ncbi:MAG: nucleotidyl transferase AbiEii/AbiGii toxin family protein [Mycobacterium sp.]
MLQALDADLLRTHRCYFGGGTAIVLRNGEYRESADIDFLVSDINGYREIRELLTGTAGVNALTREPLKPLREIRADQYGIRTSLDVEGDPIKFEIIHEGRIALDTPGSADHICGVTTLSALDTAASKLLANADRWADRSTFSRDLIDLAMLTPPSALLKTAIDKAANAYGNAIERCLSSAIGHLIDNPARLGECMRALQMFTTPEAVLRQNITRLGR